MLKYCLAKNRINTIHNFLIHRTPPPQQTDIFYIFLIKLYVQILLLFQSDGLFWNLNFFFFKFQFLW